MIAEDETAAARAPNLYWIAPGHSGTSVRFGEWCRVSRGRSFPELTPALAHEPVCEERPLPLRRVRSVLQYPESLVARWGLSRSSRAQDIKCTAIVPSGVGLATVPRTVAAITLGYAAGPVFHASLARHRKQAAIRGVPLQGVGGACAAAVAKPLAVTTAAGAAGSVSRRTSETACGRVAGLKPPPAYRR